jgi:ABC-type branched-subunit amino acid transport system substrate-binding protein
MRRSRARTRSTQPERPNRLRRSAILATAATAATVAAGCGTPDGAAGRAACTTPGFSADSVKIGWVYPDSGAVSSGMISARSGFVARVEQQNAAGGIHGRKITFAWRDDAGSNLQNLQAMHDLVDNERVFGVVESTTAAAGGADFLHAQGIPVAGLPAEPLWADHTYNNMFAHGYLITNGPSVDVFGTFVRAKGGTKAAMVLSDSNGTANQISEKIAESLRAAGIPVSPQTFIYNESSSNPLQLGQQLKAAGVDTVIGTLPAADASDIMTGAHTAGAQIRVFLSAAGYNRAILQEKGPTIAGLYTYMNYVPFVNPTPAHDRYLAAIQAYAPELEPPDQEMALLSYIGTDIFLTGLLRGPDCQGSGVIAV